MVYSEFPEKFEVDEIVFIQHYVVGNQCIRLHFLKDEKKKKKN